MILTGGLLSENRSETEKNRMVENDKNFNNLYFTTENENDIKNEIQMTESFVEVYRNVLKFLKRRILHNKHSKLLQARQLYFWSK